ncbi:MAG: GxxExxY protein [Candidatus Marinimicrobia bacterium]|nr:GxxExxY protein [Candidatus Neomarinimicrobiota bacterium]
MIEENITLKDIYGGNKDWFKKQKKKNDIKDPETYALIGLAMEVYNNIGSGFLEAVYQEALEKEFRLIKLPYLREQKLEVDYKGVALDTFYKADYICYDSIIVELNALSYITSKEESQVINYLKVTGLKRALLLNFGSRSLQYKRFIYGNYKPETLD